MNTPEDNNFTILRLVLALLVVLGHFTILPHGGPAYGIFGLADFAVDTFFVVSGYLIFASFDMRPAVGNFYIRRVFRIYPLYMTVVVVQGLIMAVLAGGILANSEDLLSYLGLNLVMANFLAHDINGLLSGLNNPGINPSLWTLKIELSFYFLLPLLWYLTQRFGWRFLLLVFVCSTTYVAIMLHFGSPTLAKQLPGQMRFFIVGMALYHYRHHITIPTIPLAAVAVALCLFTKFYHHLPVAVPIYPIATGLLMFVCVFRLPRIALPFDVSYGVYLLHGPLIQFSLLLGIYQHTMGFLALLLAVVLMFALLAERLIEQPCIELGKRLARQWSARISRVQA